MAKMKGKKKVMDRLNRMSSDKMARKVAQALYAGGQEIEIEAEISITQGSVSGKGHVPSKPGEPPNADTRLLDTNIETEIVSVARPPRVTVTSKAPYSAALEYGTSKMAERPFMRPALAKKRDDVVRMTGIAVNAVIRGK